MAKTSDVNVIEQDSIGKDEKMSSTTRPSLFSSTSDMKPYTIMSCDTPRLLLFHIKLKVDNYEKWATSILTSMRRKRKKCFINGSMKWLLSDSPELNDWVTWTLSLYSGFLILLMRPSLVLFFIWQTRKIFETIWKCIFFYWEWTADLRTKGGRRKLQTK